MRASNVFLTGPQVRERYGISAMTLWRWQRDPRLCFPGPIEIHGRKRWRESDLANWEGERIASGGTRRAK